MILMKDLGVWVISLVSLVSWSTDRVDSSNNSIGLQDVSEQYAQDSGLRGATTDDQEEDCLTWGNQKLA